MFWFEIRTDWKNQAAHPDQEFTRVAPLLGTKQTKRIEIRGLIIQFFYFIPLSLAAKCD